MNRLEMKELWTKAKQGDLQAWNTLYLAYWQANVAMAKRITKNLEDAEDAVQEAWLAAWEHRATLKELSGGFMRLAIFRRATDIVRSRHARRVVSSYPIQGEDEMIELPPPERQPEPESVARKWIEA